MRRSVLAVLLLAPACVPVYAQSAPQPAEAPASSASAAETPGQPVLDAEALIVKSDWKGAEAKLTPWLADHSTDARALFGSAGFGPTLQNKLDDAAGFYRRAVEADPKRFEAHLLLGLLLARQRKLEEARPELQAATSLDPGEAGPSAKARAWRALARIDRDQNPSSASTDLLSRPSSSTPETQEDTLMAADLAEKPGRPTRPRPAYRRVLAADSGEQPGQCRPGPPSDRPQAISGSGNASARRARKIAPTIPR